MLSLGQKQSLRQEQKLSPQVIQYIKLLTKTTLELEQRIKEEIEDNPLLEEGEEPIENAEEASSAEAAATTEESDDSTSKDEEYDWEYFLNSSDDLHGHKVAMDQ